LNQSCSVCDAHAILTEIEVTGIAPQSSQQLELPAKTGQISYSCNSPEAFDTDLGAPNTWPTPRSV